MHLAPEVNYSVKRSRWQARVIACASLLALLTLAIFARDQTVWDVHTGQLALAILMATIPALVEWKQSPQGSLRWDGQHWYWSGFAGNPVCCLSMVMDCQSLILVTVKSDAKASAFLWLEATPEKASWKALRRSIVSSQAVLNGKDPKIGSGVQGDLA